MPAATTRDDLLTAFDRERAKLDRTLSGVDADMADRHAADDPTTIKSVIAHRTHWIGLFFDWYEQGLAGKTVETPAPGVKWNQLKSYNAAIYEDGAARPWTEVRDGFERAADDLRAFIADGDDALLYAPGLYPWMNKWTLGRWAEASGPSHFRSANAYVRKVLRDNATA
ncbi:MAG: ClbS/DfsB family four-helix bundle protein [Roseitalea porphyridii]|uniref:ClbS/DfsB family four-helix bundle protein n=1 Tax=Roseitalea porphyridii TaxID=1852022 RepID=UPI0032D9161F